MNTEQGEELMCQIYEKLANNTEYEMFDCNKVDDMRITRNLEHELMIEIEKDGKAYVLTMIEKEIEE